MKDRYNRYGNEIGDVFSLFFRELINELIYLLKRITKITNK